MQEVYYLDHEILLTLKKDKSSGKAIAQAAQEKGLVSAEKPLEIALGWTSLLEILDCGSLFEQFPKFDEKSPLFHIIVEVLEKGLDKEVVMQLFDRVFAECLTLVKALPQISPNFLLQKINEKLSDRALVTCEVSFYSSLEARQIYLNSKPKEAMHDLILYLGFDRVCVYLAAIFEHIFLDETAQKGLEVLKNCLLESFQHITSQGKTAPGFFRLCETLYAYEMREERLQSHTEAEWLILCQGARTLRPRESLSDLFHIDEALRNSQEHHPSFKKIETLNYVTIESEEIVLARHALVAALIEKIKTTEPHWKYTLSSVNVIYTQLT